MVTSWRDGNIVKIAPKCGTRQKNGNIVFNIVTKVSREIGWLFPYVNKQSPTPLHSCDVTIGVKYADALCLFSNFGIFFLNIFANKDFKLWLCVLKNHQRSRKIFFSKYLTQYLWSNGSQNFINTVIILISNKTKMNHQNIIQKLFWVSL